MISKCSFGAFLLLALSIRVVGQRNLDYDAVVIQQNRVDARDLGYPPIDVIPDGESAITALTIAPTGKLYGATSGRRSHLFVLDPQHGYVHPLGFLQNTMAVANALVVSSQGDVYLGSSPSGHLLKYTPTLEDQQPLRVNEPLPTTDLGQAVSGESISALAIDRQANIVYGLTYPNAHLFKFVIATATFLDLGVVAYHSPAEANKVDPKEQSAKALVGLGVTGQHAPEGEKFETEKMISRALAIDLNGNVYASGEDGFLFEFNKAKQVLERLPNRVPAIPGREPWTRVDAFLTDPSGLIYGGTSDGYLFRLDPETLTVTNLGKPLLEYRICGLTLAADGKLFGVGGDKDDLARLFSYDPKTGGYKIYGFIDVNRRPYYTWQAYVVGAMTTGHDGTIYIGESERMSRLYLFYPW